MSTHETEKAQEKPPQHQTPWRRSPGPLEEMERWWDDVSQRVSTAPFSRRLWPDWPEVKPVFGGGRPRLDIIDRPDDILVRAELPGIAKDDLDVSLGDNSLTIHATAREEEAEESAQFVRRELSRGEFQRTVELPYGINGDKAKARFKDGILELTLPKVESAKRKSIKIE